MLLDSLVDDAALFPPGSAAMPSAVHGHLRHSGTPHAAVVGRFVCPASRLPECAAELTGDTRLGVAVVADTGVRRVAAALDFAARTHRLVPQTVEIPLPADASEPTAAARDLVAAVPELPTYVEVPRVDGWRAVLDVLADSGRCAKLRTGGTTPEAFPAAAGVAAFIRGCVERELPFNCTAGLHRALRWQDPALGWNHGFVNVLAAVHAALSGASSSDLVDLLEQTRAEAALAALPQTDEEKKAVRAAWHGFGSCSVHEPVEDLQRLGLLP